MSDMTNIVRFLQQENTRLKEENERLTEKLNALEGYILALDALEQAARSLSKERDLMGLLDKTLSYAIGVLGASDGSLMLLDEDTGDLVFVLVHGQVREVLPGYRIRGDEGIAGWIAQHGEPALVNNPRSDPRFSVRVDQAFNFETRSLIGAPLITRHKVLGVVEVVNKVTPPGEFAPTDVNLLSILALLAASVLDDLASQPDVTAVLGTT